MGKKGFTYDEHVILAGRLKQARQIIVSAVTETADRVGSSSRSHRLATQVLDRLDELRCELDNVLCRDFPDREYRGVYYGEIKSTD